MKTADESSCLSPPVPAAGPTQGEPHGRLIRRPELQADVVRDSVISLTLTHHPIEPALRVRASEHDEHKAFP